MQILALVVSYFYHFEGSFYFWAHFSFFLFSVGRHRAPFSLLCATFSSFVCFVFAGLCSTQLFPYWFCSHQFAELGSIQCLAFSPRACSLAFLSFAILFLAICRAFLFYLFLFYYFIIIIVYADLFFSGLCLALSLFSYSVDFSYSKGSLFLGDFSWVFFYRAFLLSGSVLFSTPYIGLLCFLRMHAINSCVGDTWQRLWWDNFTHNGEQAVNRLKIPQGLSTLMFCRWSEVPSRGGVRGDSP